MIVTAKLELPSHGAPPHQSQPTEKQMDREAMAAWRNEGDPN